MIIGVQIRHWEANFLDQTTIRLHIGDFEVGENALRDLDVRRPL